MHIPQTIIDEINNRADLVEVIGKHLKLKRAGHNYFTCCPFHNEKSPSFSVNPVKQFYHCFGCGESGNAISFIMKYCGFDFVTAVKTLADQYGIFIPEDQTAPRLTREQQDHHKQYKLALNQLMQKITVYYQQQLNRSNLAQHYLQQRGLSAEISAKFSLGFAPAAFNNLTQVVADYNTNQLLVASGMVVNHDENNKRFDRFRERIIFPIKNIKGDIIGFGGRILAQGQPKYLNSPETELFNKSKELYGLYQAKKSIQESNQVIVVEGYMDVLTLHQYGLSNVVATMGTAVTEEQIKILFRLCDNICYSFDGDSAGRKAGWRALERSLSLITDIKAVNFLFLPPEHDPDSYIRQFGVAGFQDKLNNGRMGIITFLLNQLLLDVNITTDEGKARLISLTKPYLEQVKALALHVILKKQLAQLVELEPTVVESILNNRSRFAFYNRSLKNLNNSYQNNLARQPLNINLLETIILALFSQPLLARWFPLPELEILAAKDQDLSELFKLISYLEAHCDDFADIQISAVIKISNFSHINLANLYNKVLLERKNFTNIFTVAPTDYCRKLHELVYEKKRPRMPKLN